MNFDQGQFNFDDTTNEAGYSNWVKELDQKKVSFERRWGVRIGKPVRLQLRNFAKPIEGIIFLDPDHHPSPGKPHRLLIGSLPFFPNEIESLSLINLPE